MKLRGLSLRLAPITLLLVGALGTACSGGDSQKSWNALATCLAGPAATAPIAARVSALRQIQLAFTIWAGNDAWPKSSGARADELYAAHGSATETAMLKRKLQERMACNDNKGSCTPPTDSSLISVATELWEAATSGGLKTDVASDVTPPAIAPAPLLAATAWKSFSDKPLKLVGPLLTPDGRAILLLKASEGRARPRGCEFTAGLSKVSCFDGNADVPELPAQTVDLVNDTQSVYAAGLTEKGLSAYDLKSGKVSDVRGAGALQLVHDGLAVEHGDNDQGFQAVLLANGKAGKPIKLSAKGEFAGSPVALGSQLLALEQSEAGTEFVARSATGNRLVEGDRQKGAFAGAIHGCRKDSALAALVYGARAGQHGAKATAGGGKTQIAAKIFHGSWSKAAEATIPFERAIDSDVVCTKAGASLAFALPADGGIQVGRVDCDANACKASDVKIPGVESKWWWTVGPVGDKVLVMWRSPLGDTRLRIAPLADLPTTKDVIVFDAPDFGGPNAGELTSLFDGDSALLLFHDEKPVALHIGAEGTVRVVAP